jgi:uncharacterized membrane protein YfcA
MDTYSLLTHFSHVAIGLASLVVPACLIWLYNHRRSDWPKAWAMLLIGLFLLSVGSVRILSAIDLEYFRYLVLFLNIVAAIIGFGGSFLIPWAVRILAKLPSLEEYEHQWRGNQQRHVALAEAARLSEEKRRAEMEKRITQERMDEMKSLLDHAIVDPKIRSRILFLADRRE